MRRRSSRGADLGKKMPKSCPNSGLSLIPIEYRVSSLELDPRPKAKKQLKLSILLAKFWPQSPWWFSRCHPSTEARHKEIPKPTRIFYFEFKMASHSLLGEILRPRGSKATMCYGTCGSDQPYKQFSPECSQLFLLYLPSRIILLLNSVSMNLFLHGLAGC